MTARLDRELWWDWERVAALSPEEREARRRVEDEKAIEECQTLRSRVRLFRVRDEKTAEQLDRLCALERVAIQRASETRSMKTWLLAKQEGRL